MAETMKKDRDVQRIVERIDECVRNNDNERLTLKALSSEIGYSEYHTSRLFREISGLKLKDYLRLRRLAFALKDVRDTEDGILDIATRYGYSSNEAFSRVFKKTYGISPRDYRKNPIPAVLRTIIKPFDCYLMEGATRNMEKIDTNDIKIYYIRIPAHKFLHIRNYESIGYWDFWQKQGQIPGQDCDTICGLLDSIKGKLDDIGGKEENAGSGQLMAWINAPTGRICSWGIPLAEAYGARLPIDYNGPIPEQMQIMDVEEGEYIVYEHGPFDFEKESEIVEAKIETAMKEHDYAKDGYELDLTPERVFYFYHDCERFFKYVRPVKKIDR